MTETLRVACVQPSSGQDLQANLDAAGALVREARAAGAELIALPENVALMEHRTELVRANAAPLDAHPAARFFSALAEEPARGCSRARWERMLATAAFPIAPC